MNIEVLNVDRRRARRLVNMSALVSLMRPLEITVPDPVMRRRQLVADLCRLVGESVGPGAPGDRPCRPTMLYLGGRTKRCNTCFRATVKNRLPKN